MPGGEGCLPRRGTLGGLHRAHAELEDEDLGFRRTGKGQGNPSIGGIRWASRPCSATIPAS